MNREDYDINRTDDYILRYIKGQMSGNEIDTFEKRLAEDSTLRNKAIATARLAKAMKEAGDDSDHHIIQAIKSASKDEIKKAAVSAYGDTTVKTMARSFRKTILYFSAAASVALCVFGGYKYYKYQQTTSLGAEYLRYFNTPETYRGENSEINSKLNVMYADIETRTNLEDVTTALSAMWKQSRQDVYNEYTAYMPEIGWMLANAHLCNNDKTEGEKILDALIKEFPQGTAMGDKARELKNKIEEL